MIVAGLDLSLVKTGVVILKDNGKVLYAGLVKSKPNGDQPVDEIERLNQIVTDILEILYSPEYIGKIDLVVIENLAFMARNTTALTQLAGLSYLIRTELWGEADIPFVMVAPTSLKKFITGSGKGDKDQMQMMVYKDYGFIPRDNNESDAYSLAVCGLAILGKPLKKILKAQQEVISLLIKQI